MSRQGDRYRDKRRRNDDRDDSRDRGKRGSREYSNSKGPSDSRSYYGNGDGGGRGRGSRGTTHMGELNHIKQLLRHESMSDTAILPVINGNQSKKEQRDLNYSFMLPKPEPWRLVDSVGIALDNWSGKIRVNALQMNVSKIPQIIYQYRVEVRRVLDTDGTIDTEDITSKRTNEYLSVAVIAKLLLDLRINPARGVSYDGSHSLNSTFPLSPEDDDQQLVHSLPFRSSSTGSSSALGSSSSSSSFYSASSSSSSSTSSSSSSPTSSSPFNLNPNEIKGSSTTSGMGQAIRTYIVTLPSGMKYHVKLMVLNNALIPLELANHNRWKTFVSILDVALLSFARWQLIDEKPEWFIDSNKIYRSDGNFSTFQANKYLLAMKGYSSALKICKAGLVLMTDLSVSVFLKGGELIDVIVYLKDSLNYHKEDFLRDAEYGRLSESELTKSILPKLKNIKVLITHVHHHRKLREFGPPANSKESEFDYNGRTITVADYFKICFETQPTDLLTKALPGGQLKYPFLPTINIGSKKRAILIPIELVIVPPGQSRPVDSSIQAQVIRMTAMSPDDRYKYITDPNLGLPSVVVKDSICDAYGLSSVNQQLMEVDAKLLPPARLRYGEGKVIEPGIAGKWEIHGLKFYDPARSISGSQTIKYGIVIVNVRSGWETRVEDFRVNLEREAHKVGMDLHLGGRPLVTDNHPEAVDYKLAILKGNNADFALVILQSEHDYTLIKLAAADRLLPTQVIKYDRVNLTPKGIYLNLLLKINTKIGGINHVLASRVQSFVSSSSPTSIPSSISWLVDNQSTMIMGLDFSETSYMGAVGTMDRKLAHYGAFICKLARDNEIYPELEIATFELLQAYYHRNNRTYPRNIIVYRDGMSDSEYDLIIDEVSSIKRAARRCFSAEGENSEEIRVTVIMCQKRHRVRFFFEEKNPDNTLSYYNPCPGICVDGTSSKSIVEDRYIEFYVNSHAPVQGTCKPCKYVVLYDDVGLKLSEMELMSYWLTYMYARCNRSVSYPAPTYYAHWVSQRAKILSSYADPEELLKISRDWLHQSNSSSSMFFV